MVPPLAPANELKAPGEAVYAWLEIDGVKAEIYKENVEGNVVSGWVESKVGAEVVLCFRLGMRKPKHDVSARGYADGSEFDNLALEAGGYFLHSQATSSRRKQAFSGTAISATAEKRLEFTPITFTENEDFALQNQAIIAGLGTIKLKVEYGTVYGPAQGLVFLNGPIDQTPIYRGSMAELDMTERIKLGRTTGKPFSQSYFEQLPGNNGVIGEFKFYYRSRDILERRRIIDVPASDSSSSSGSESDFTPPSTPPTSCIGKRASDCSLAFETPIKRKMVDELDQHRLNKLIELNRPLSRPTWKPSDFLDSRSPRGQPYKLRT